MLILYDAWLQDSKVLFSTQHGRLPVTAMGCNLQKEDQHYCHNTALNKLLQSLPLVCQGRLKRVKTVRAAYLKESQNQQMMNKYVMLIQQTRDIFTPRETQPPQTPTHRARHKT